MITVTRIRIPAWSTVGYVEGYDEEGHVVTCLMDHRPARNLGLDMDAGEVVVFEPEPWTIVSRINPNMARKRATQEVS